MNELVPWGFRCVAVLVALAYIGVGATVVRAAKPTSGYLLIAVGAFTLLARCCSTAVVMGVTRGGADPDLFALVSLMTIGETILTGILIAVAAVLLAQAAREPSSAPPSPGPTPAPSQF